MIKNPISNHLGTRYHFLTTRKLISGQKYYRNNQKMKKYSRYSSYNHADQTQARGRALVNLVSSELG